MTTPAAVIECPFAIKYAFRYRTEVHEEIFRQIKTAIGTARALKFVYELFSERNEVLEAHPICDLCLCRNAIESHSNPLEAVGSRVSRPELIGIQSDDLYRVGNDFLNVQDNAQNRMGH